VSFTAITLCIASQQVFIVVSVYFIIDSVWKLFDTPLHLHYITKQYTPSVFFLLFPVVHLQKAKANTKTKMVLKYLIKMDMVAMIMCTGSKCGTVLL